MKKGCCIGCAAVLLAAVVIVGILCYVLFAGQTEVTTDISYYQALSGETEGPCSLEIRGEREDIFCPYELPKLAELEPYEGLRFHYQARQIFVFQAHSYILILQYDEGVYEQQIAALEEKYTWRTEGIEGETEAVDPDFELDGFTFRCAEGGYYPKEMLCIGTDETRREIAIIYFYDQDLDFVDPDMAAFLIDETGWNSIR